MQVTLDKVSKLFGNIKAVDDVCIQVNDGEFVALLGPSGCGKTTTLLMIAGIYKPTGGRILFGERVVNDLLPKDRKIGMVFQSYALYPHMSVFENIVFPLRLQRVPEKQLKERAHKMAELVQIEELMDRKPGQLSGGQQQRVALSRALVKEPDILLLDEPLSNLDAKLRIVMRAEIKRLQKRLGITTIFVTHDQLEALTMADRIALLNNGKLVAYSQPHDLYDHPRTIFAAEFIGSPPMNFLRLKIEAKDGSVALVGEGIQMPLAGEIGQKVKALGVGREVVLGIRPEDITVATDSGDAKAEVYVVEPLGRDMLVDLYVEATHVRVLAPPTFNAPIGASVALTLDRNKIHLFDPQTEQALLNC
jgi:inositol-phosphate transport system ATP-binding protein